MVIRILCMGSVPPDWGGATGGGVANLHRTLINELRGSHDYNVQVIGILPFNLDSNGDRRPPLENVLQPPWDGREQAFYQKVLGELKPDVVLFQHIVHRWAVYHYRIKTDVPAVGVIHSWSSLKNETSAEHARKVLSEALRGMSRLVFVSQRTLEEGKRLGVDYDLPEHVIHNPVEWKVLDESIPIRTPRNGWVFLGQLIPRKNPMAALIAAAQCGAHLTFVGSGPGEGDLRAAVVRMDVQEQVTFAGWLPSDRIQAVLSHAELLCVPSFSEGFSIAYLEALACGVPVIGNGPNVVEISERIGTPAGIPVWEGDPDEVTAAAQEAQRTDWDRRELRARVASCFSPDAVATSYAEIITDTVVRAHRAL